MEQSGGFDAVSFGTVYGWPGGLIVADGNVVRGVDKLERSEPKTPLCNFTAERRKKSLRGAARLAMKVGIG
jgi:hypothetical protein